MIAAGIRTTEVRDSSGTVISSNTAPFETMWAMRRATGARWLTIAELPVPDNA
jgi:predicted lipid-binding transport protein (Tim44 family)